MGDAVARFIDGPFWYFSLAVFVVGVIWRLFSILRPGVKSDLAEARGSALGGAIGANLRRFFPRREIAGQTRFQVFAGYLFHLGLFALLFFAAPHVEFYRDRITGFAWPSMPYWAFILASEAAFLGLLFLWLYRTLNPVTRLISSKGDHFASILIFVVMLTGCLALLRSHEPLRLLHFFSAELLLIYFPFSSLMHTFTFVFSRGYTGANLGRKGIRA